MSRYNEQRSSLRGSFVSEALKKHRVGKSATKNGSSNLAFLSPPALLRSLSGGSSPKRPGANYGGGYPSAAAYPGAADTSAVSAAVPGAGAAPPFPMDASPGEQPAVFAQQPLPPPSV